MNKEALAWIEVAERESRLSNETLPVPDPLPRMLLEAGALHMRSLLDYQTVVEKAHAIMDAAGVPKADGETCNDPDCDSKLIHRIKFLLRDRPVPQGDTKPVESGRQ